MEQSLLFIKKKVSSYIGSYLPICNLPNHFLKFNPKYYSNIQTHHDIVYELLGRVPDEQSVYTSMIRKCANHPKFYEFFSVSVNSFRFLGNPFGLVVMLFVNPLFVCKSFKIRCLLFRILKYSCKSKVCLIATNTIHNLWYWHAGNYIFIDNQTILQLSKNSFVRTIENRMFVKLFTDQRVNSFPQIQLPDGYFSIIHEASKSPLFMLWVTTIIKGDLLNYDITHISNQYGIFQRLSKQMYDNLHEEHVARVLIFTKS